MGKKEIKQKWKGPKNFDKLAAFTEVLFLEWRVGTGLCFPRTLGFFYIFKITKILGNS